MPYARSTDELGMRPVRLDQLGFVEPALVDINAAALDGSAGSRRYVWDGTDKFVAYAPIPYTGGAYDLPAGFGWVGIGANVKRFHAAAADVERAITSQTRQLEIQTLLMIAATALLVSGGALVLAHTLTHPLLTLTDAARALEAEELDETCLAQLRAAPGSDEVAHLSHVFATMAEQVRARTRRLRREVEHLRIRIDEEKREQQVSQITETDYFQDLQEKARRMRRE
jgi:HAMP domain-containing protein